MGNIWSMKEGKDDRMIDVQDVVKKVDDIVAQQGVIRKHAEELAKYSLKQEKNIADINEYKKRLESILKEEPTKRKGCEEQAQNEQPTCTNETCTSYKENEELKIKISELMTENQTLTGKINSLEKNTKEQIFQLQQTISRKEEQLRRVSHEKNEIERRMTRSNEENQRLRAQCEQLEEKLRQKQKGESSFLGTWFSWENTTYTGNPPSPVKSKIPKRPADTVVLYNMGNIWSMKEGKDDRMIDVQDVVKKVDDIVAQQGVIRKHAEELAKYSLKQEKDIADINEYKKRLESILKEEPTKRKGCEEQAQNEQPTCTNETCTSYKENEELKIKISELMTENQTLTGKINSLEKNTKEQIFQLQQTISRKEEQLRRVSHEKNEIERRMTRSNEENQKLRAQCEQLEEKLRQKQKGESSFLGTWFSWENTTYTGNPPSPVKSKIPKRPADTVVLYNMGNIWSMKEGKDDRMIDVQDVVKKVDDIVAQQGVIRKHAEELAKYSLKQEKDIADINEYKKRLESILKEEPTKRKGCEEQAQNEQPTCTNETCTSYKENEELKIKISELMTENQTLTGKINSLEKNTKEQIFQLQQTISRKEEQLRRVSHEKNEIERRMTRSNEENQKLRAQCEQLEEKLRQKQKGESSFLGTWFSWENTTYTGNPPSPVKSKIPKRPADTVVLYNMGNIWSMKEGKDDRMIDVQDVVKKVDDIVAQQGVIRKHAEELAKYSLKQEKDIADINEYKKRLESILKEEPTKRKGCEEQAQNEQPTCTNETCTSYKENEELKIKISELMTENQTLTGKINSLEKNTKEQIFQLQQTISRKEEQLRRVSHEKNEIERRMTRSNEENQKLRAQCEQLEEKLRQKQKGESSFLGTWFSWENTTYTGNPPSPVKSKIPKRPADTVVLYNMGNIWSMKEGKDDRMIDVQDVVKKVDDIVAQQGVIRKHAEELAKYSLKQEKNIADINEYKKRLESILKEEPTKRKGCEEQAQNEQPTCTNETCTSYKENEELKIKISELMTENQTLTGKINSLEKNTKEQIFQLQQTISRKEEQLRRVSHEKNEIERKMTRSNEENQRLRAQCEQLEEKLRQKQKGESSFLGTWFSWGNTTYTGNPPSPVKSKIPKRPAVQVLLYCAVQQKLLNEVSSNLTATLTTQMDTKGYNLQIDPCPDPQNRPADIPFIVLCINASRLGTDVTQALQNVTCDHCVALVILHNKKIHTLPAQTSERLLIGQEYKKLGLIVDIAYVSSDGMYPCNMNENALTKLCQFIGNFR